MHYLRLFPALRLALITALFLAPARAADPLRYNRDIRPILSDNCFACHGPDKSKVKGELRLDVRESAVKAAKSGEFAIVPGDAKNSELVRRIFSTDEDEVMPKPESHKSLTAPQKAMLKRWIEQGAKYEPHWAFVPLEPVTVPTVKRQNWARNDLDRFILSRLESEQLTPSPEAAKETLIRRVTLDLTGLPPTLAEVDAYLADQSPQSYENVVERLLKSPHYGERMAVDWLDAARYADTNGYQVDRDRELWPWRDWVIKAFNDNQRFDQFTIEQIAGDLLPNATLEQRIASGFNRNPMLNEEGAIIAEEFLADMVADRVETTAAVWLAQTFNCCRCHDHKFDPFTQRDFYSLKAFFHNVTETGIGRDGTPIRINAPPFVKLPAPEIEAKIAALSAEVLELEQAIKVADADAAKAKATVEKNQVAATLAWTILGPTALTSASGAKLTIQPDGAILASGANPANETYTLTAPVTLGTIFGLRVEALPDDSLPAHGPGRAINGNFVMTDVRLVVNAPAVAARSVDLKTAVADFSQAQFPVANAIDADPSSGWAIQPELGKPHTAVFAPAAPITVDPGATVTITLSFNSPNTNHQLGRFRLAVTNAPTAVAQLATTNLPQPEQKKLSDPLNALKKQIAKTESEFPTTLVMDEMKEARPTFILIRGAYDKKGELVTAATPAVLPPIPEGEPRNRLSLAKWLVSPQNPLPARVTVNRFWQQVFGTGLVKTSENFGAQGAPPSHPELLDWLALEFIRSGWDVKHLMTLMVTSATYRQQSQLTPLLHERDLENRLLARGPRFRLMGEFVRDQALTASGLLVDKIGGPSVKPYHPPGLYEQVASGSSGTTTYVPGKGDDLYRRSLYTYWKRSVPHPAMLAFGTPFRETCTLQRTRSNTPLQALNLMNDDTYTEASRFLAERMIRDGGTSMETQLTHGFRLVLSRAPQPQEMRVLIRAYDRALADFQNDAAAVISLLNIGDKKTDPNRSTPQLAAMATVASTILCLDETVTKQ